MLLDPGGGFTSETAARRFQKRNGRYETVPEVKRLQIYNRYNISHPHSSWTPGVFYTYFYNHAHRLRLEKLLYLELSRSPNGFF